MYKAPPHSGAISVHRIPKSHPLLRYRVFGIFEIRTLLDLSKTRTNYICDRPDFPLPLETLGHGRIWKAVDVIRWALETGRLIIETEV